MELEKEENVEAKHEDTFRRPTTGPENEENEQMSKNSDESYLHITPPLIIPDDAKDADLRMRHLGEMVKLWNDFHGE